MPADTIDKDEVTSDDDAGLWCCVGDVVNFTRGRARVEGAFWYDVTCVDLGKGHHDAEKDSKWGHTQKIYAHQRRSSLLSCKSPLKHRKWLDPYYVHCEGHKSGNHAAGASVLERSALTLDFF